MTMLLTEIKTADIRPHPNNPRTDVGDVAELAASIREQGLLQPLTVVPKPGTKATYHLLIGHRRLAAAKAAGLTVVPAVVRDDLADDQPGQCEVMLVENLQRTDLTPMEEAHAYQHLLEFPGYTMKRVVKATGRSQATVKGRIALTTLPEPTQAKIQDGQITIADAQALAEFAGDKQRLARLTRTIGTAEFRWELETARRGRKKDQAEARLRKELTAAGVTIAPSSSLWDGSAKQLAALHLPSAEHTDCPGHAAVISTSGAEPRVVYVCTQPAEHPDPDGSTVARVAADGTVTVEAVPDPPAASESADDTPPPVSGRAAAAVQKRDAENAAKQAARQQMRDDLAIAAAVRRAYLAGEITAGARAHALAVEQATRRLRAIAEKGAYAAPGALRLYRDLLAAPDGASAADLIARIGKLTVYQLTVLNYVLAANEDAAAECDEQLLTDDEDFFASPYSGEPSMWVAVLQQQLGYQLTDFEQGLLDAAAEQASNRRAVGAQR